MSYMINYNEMKDGDIVLCAFDDDTSRLIQKMSGCQYSHAMLFHQKSLIEATTGGVFSQNPQRYLFNAIKEVCVVRLNENIDSDKMSKICCFARDKVMTAYTTEEARRSIKKNDTNENAKTPEQFCTRLVAQAYASEGINIVNNENYCTTKDILCSPKLDIVENMTHEPTSEEIEIFNRPSQVYKNFCEIYKWFSQAVELAEKVGYRIYKQNDVHEFLKEYPQFDSDICNFIRNTEYLTQFNDDRGINAYRFNKNLYIEKLKKYDSVNKLGFMLSEARDIIDTLERSFYQACVFKELEHIGLEYTKLENELYISLGKLNKEKFLIILETARYTGVLEPFIFHVNSLPISPEVRCILFG